VGEVSLIEPLGADTFIEVAAGGIAVTCRIEPELPIQLGDRVRVGLPSMSLHLFDAATGDRINA
jgi:multiple sugar transport system ATP-binding protein